MKLAGLQGAETEGTHLSRYGPDIYSSRPPDCIGHQIRHDGRRPMVAYGTFSDSKWVGLSPGSLLEARPKTRGAQTQW